MKFSIIVYNQPQNNTTIVANVNKCTETLDHNGTVSLNGRISCRLWPEIHQIFCACSGDIAVRNAVHCLRTEDALFRYGDIRD